MSERVRKLYQSCNIGDNHSNSDYFILISKLVQLRREEGQVWQRYIDQVYTLILDEICSNVSPPVTPVTFGTSGWRGVLGKDFHVRSVSFVTAAIVKMYQAVSESSSLLSFLGVASLAEARQRGCVVGFDNRFAGEVLASAVVRVLRTAGFVVHYAGESTTGVLSATLLELNAAFSINLTPSHNPLEYGGFKYNAADGGPAAKELTEFITVTARKIIQSDRSSLVSFVAPLVPVQDMEDINFIDSLALWQNMVRKNKSIHGLDLDFIMQQFHSKDDFVVVVDSIHGSSRLHIDRLFGQKQKKHQHLIHLRAGNDVTFDGVAPEPSSYAMQGVINVLASCSEKLKLGAVIDPDGDRIRFTDGTREISMNQFGAMAYHFLHTVKEKKGLVAKTVATSNMANQLALGFGEDVFESRVGFKEFKPVVGKALVFFEESDGISCLGHTPEKDAYIGLLMALDMIMTLDVNLGDYLAKIESEYGTWYPGRQGITAIISGDYLKNAFMGLQKYKPGTTIRVGEEDRKIVEVITIDGRKILFQDGSWLMLRLSGTEAKVRLYVESVSESDTVDLINAARNILAELGCITKK